MSPSFAIPLQVSQCPIQNARHQVSGLAASSRVDYHRSIYGLNRKHGPLLPALTQPPNFHLHSHSTIHHPMLRSGLSDGSLVCVCGRSFSLPTALSKHERSCKSSKKCLSGALENARRFLTGNKRRRLHIDAAEVNQHPPPGLMPESSLDTIVDPEVRSLAAIH